MRRWRAISVLCAVTIGGAAGAQDYIPVPPQIEGELTAIDSADPQGRRYDEYALELDGGDAVMVAATPSRGSRTEPVIEIYDAAGVARLARDGRSGGDNAARLLFTSPDRDVYRIRVVAGTAAAGRYVLRLSRGSAANGNRGAVIGGAVGAGIDGAAIGAIVGGIFGGAGRTPPAAPRGPEENASSPATPRARFIICPGHPRCPR